MPKTTTTAESFVVAVQNGHIVLALERGERRPESRAIHQLEGGEDTGG